MGWESRRDGEDWREGRGSAGGFFRRVFGDGENPLTWAVPLYRAWGIQVKIHIFFIILIIARLIWAIPQDRMGLWFVVIGMIALFVLVLLHEYGHCIACRRVGGTADQILMWPLGGLAMCSPPHNWRDDLITTVGGPGVNVLLWPVFGAALWIVLPSGAVMDALVFNPFRPELVIGGLRLSDGTQPLWLIALWWFYYINIILLFLNVLLPMYPMDGARIVQAILWRRMGHRRATGIVVTAGLVTALVIFAFSLIGDARYLMGLAVFGGIVCWIERRRLRMTEDPVLGGLPGYDFDKGYLGMPGEEEPDLRRERAEEKRRKKAEAEQAELDRILAKIAATGMASLTRAEKRWLERATQKRRAR